MPRRQYGTGFASFLVLDGDARAVHVAKRFLCAPYAGGVLFGDDELSPENVVAEQNAACIRRTEESLRYVYGSRVTIQD